GRLVVVVSKTEIGWETIRTQWEDASIGMIGLGHEPVDCREPKTQAQYWISTVDEILGNQNESAELKMGAAWILDSPGIRYMQHYVKQSDHTSTLPRFGLSLDQDAIDAEESRFENQCRARCLALAEHATSLNPADVRWWRMRALLQFDPNNQDPRHAKVLEILDECSRHDPNNALYDYLAALQLWTNSAEYDWPDEEEWPDDEWRLQLRDSEMFEHGNDRFDAGQAKDFVAIGEDGFPAVTDFLNSSRLPKIDQVEVAVSRLITSRQSILFYQLWRWLGVRIDDANQHGEVDNRIRLLRQKLRMFDQFVRPDETSATDKLVTFDAMRRQAYEALSELLEENPSSLSPASLAGLRDNEQNLRIDAIVLEEALAKWEAKRMEGPNTLSFGSILAAGAVMSATCLGIVAMGAFFAKRCVGKEKKCSVEFGLVRHTAAWLIGCGGTFLFLGIAPAELISHELQTLMITALVWTIAGISALFVAWGVYLFLKRRRFQFSILSLLGVTLGAAILALFFPLFGAVFEFVDRHPPELWLHAKGSNGIDAEVLRIAMKLNQGTWLWAALQWFAHAGQYVGLVVSLLIVTFWFAWRVAHQSKEGFLNYWTRDGRQRWPILIGCVGRSAIVATTCWLTLYVWSAPALVRTAERDFQYKMRYCRDPKSHREELQAVREKIDSSATEMLLLRESVEAEFSTNEP
ncbi:MAG: hypothetical protein ACI814_002356, partial [Mariniblastus sp.]